MKTKSFSKPLPISPGRGGWGVRLRAFFIPRTWVRTRYDRNGLLLCSKKVNGVPMLRLRIAKRNGEGTIDKDIAYRDVMLITKYPSPFAKQFLFARPKNFRVKITSPIGGGREGAS